MMSILLTILTITMISMVVIFLASLLSKKTYLDREKSSPFECGFDPFSNSRIPFSLRFYMIAIIFLVFDVEIAILLPLPMIMNFMETLVWVIVSLAFVLTLIIGVIHEWNFGALDWSS